MITLWRKARSALRLPVEEKCWFTLLYPLTGLTLVTIHLAPHQWLRALYGQPLANLPVSMLATLEQRNRAKRIGRVTGLVARYTPWPSKCLVQALAAKFLLHWHGIPCVLHLGTRLTGDPEEPMKAHAWLTVGPWVVTGREGHKAYAVVGTFCSGLTVAAPSDYRAVGDSRASSKSNGAQAR